MTFPVIAYLIYKGSPELWIGPDNELTYHKYEALLIKDEQTLKELSETWGAISYTSPYPS